MNLYRVETSMVNSKFVYLFLIDSVEYTLLASTKPVDVIKDRRSSITNNNIIEKKVIYNRRNSTSSAPIIFTPPPVTSNNTKSWEDIDRGFFQSPETTTNTTTNTTINNNDFDPFKGFSNTSNSKTPQNKSSTTAETVSQSFDNFATSNDNFASSNDNFAIKSSDNFAPSIAPPSIASSLFSKVNENETNKVITDIKSSEVDDSSFTNSSVFDSFPTSENSFENFSFEESFANKSNLADNKSTPSTPTANSTISPSRGRRQSAAEISMDLMGLTLEVPVTKQSNAISDLPSPSSIIPQNHHHQQHNINNNINNNQKKVFIKPVLNDKNKEIWGNSKLINLDLNLDDNSTKKPLVIKPVNSNSPNGGGNSGDNKLIKNKQGNIQTQQVNTPLFVASSTAVKPPPAPTSLDTLSWN
jgi:hypothetical protein